MEVKNCGNCKHRITFGTAEQCATCIGGTALNPPSNWEQDDYKPDVMKTCGECIHENSGENNAPCKWCKNTEVIGTKAYESKPFLFADDKTDKVERLGLLHAEAKALYAAKNRDYGDSFHRTYIEEGMAMARIRLSDKLERFKQLSRSNEQHVHDESIRDTLMDLANYAHMTVLELDMEE